MKPELPRIRRRSKPDGRDRLILALCALLKAERQTRAAMEAAIRSGSVSPEVLEAMAADPVPAVTERDLADVERLLADDGAIGQRLQGASGQG